MDIHNYKRRFERTLERIEESSMPKRDKKIILKFKDTCLCEGISYGKIDAYLFYLTKVIKMFQKPLEKANKNDLMKIVADINQTDYSEETKVSMKIVLRKLFKMIKGTEGKHNYPEEVSWISTTISKNHKKLPAELLTDEEIKNLIRGAKTLRDKALIALLCESGCRVSEIGTMQIKHVSFEKYGARLTVSGKTGTRKILVINSTPYLQEWINQHPLNNNSDASLWHNPQDREGLSYARISAILKLAAKRASIKKRIYPHLLRHSQATYMAKIMTESAMKQYFGWTQNSKMAGVYVHMSGKDTDEAVLRANGIETKKEEIKHPMEPKKCIRCQQINEATNIYCNRCGLPLSEEQAKKIIIADADRNRLDGIMEKLLEDSDFKKLVLDKIKNIS